MASPASPLPTGTVAFLFSDVASSTRRWESHAAAMDDAVKRQEVLLRDAFARHNGHVFKTVGDAFCVAFGRASEAVGAAIEAQRVLCAEDFSAVGGLSVRMGLHVGEAYERDGDYFGPAVNVVARLTSAGHGGQVLLSDITCELVKYALPVGASVTDLGMHRVKDLHEAKRVWQLDIEGLRSKFPSLNSLGSLSNNLPIARTSLVGRANDIAEVKELLRTHRLLTLVGAGGVGKTRLAMQVGAECVDDYADGVWFVDLAPVSDERLVAGIIAKVLGINQVRGHRVDESIPRWLKRKKLLLILDNCEHLLASVAAIAEGVLDSAPDVRLLATSRQALALSGEKIVRLASLGVPDAVALFVDRATLIDRSFVLGDDAAPTVAEICRRLDGIPLAIELAAARINMLSLSSLAQRLDERFKILTGTSRAALPRQKTLRALIDWSYDLLSSQEQALFKRLSIFSGSFSLDSVTAVCATDDIEPSGVWDLLCSLADKSLVVVERGSQRERYRLLESTRAYALEKLTTEERDQFARRHGEFLRAQAEAADKRYGTESNAAWLADVEMELDNYRAALQWALVDKNDASIGGAVAGALEQLWFRGGLAVEGINWIGHALSGLDETAQTEVAARLWRAFAWLCDGKERYDAAQRALQLYESLGDENGQAWSLLFVGFGLHQMGRPEESAVAYGHALSTMRRVGNRWGAAVILNRQATVHRDRGEVSNARELYAEALREMKAVGNEASVAVVLADLAELEFADGHVKRSLELVGEALEIETKGKNATHLANVYTCSCAYRIALGSLDLAASDGREGLRWARRAQNPLAIAIVLAHFALLRALGGEATAAAHLAGYVDARYKELNYQRDVTEEWGYKRLVDELQEQLSARDRAKLEREGAAWSEDRAVEEAMKIQGDRA